MAAQLHQNSSPKANRLELTEIFNGHNVNLPSYSDYPREVHHALCVMVNTKNLTSEGRQKSPELINGDIIHPFRLIFWKEGNDPMTSGIRANPDSTPISR